MSTLLLLLSCLAAQKAQGETVLYNGIRATAPWPPKVDVLSLDPSLPPYLVDPPGVIPIDVGRQLFVDDFLIEETNLQRIYHTPRYHPDNPVLEADRPWEIADKGGAAHPFSDGVWYDPRDHLFKMWYMAPCLKSTCYAVSRDGIQWHKPDLDVVPGTNIVLETTFRDSSTVWLDHFEKDASRRFKMTLFEKSPKRGLALRCSPDGIHWSDVIKWAGPCHDRSTFFFNPFRNVWVYSLRDSRPVGGSHPVRARTYREGKDFVDAATWRDGEPALWVGADRLDPRRPGLDVQRQLYNLDAVAYESLLLGLFSVWQGPDNAVCKERGIHKRNEVLLGFSRDGFHWYRPDRRPFLGCEDAVGSWRRGNVQSAGGCCLVVGDELYFYFSGRARASEGHWDARGSTGLATLRRDGFASMDAGSSKGYLVTRPLRFTGKYAFVNADAAGGELRVEVLDETGDPVPAYTVNECVPVREDGTCQRVRWHGRDDLGDLAGKPVRFRFHLSRARLFSFWISPDASGASQGYVAAGGPGLGGPLDTAGPLSNGRSFSREDRDVEVVKISSGPQLFLDDYLVARMEGLNRTLHPPRKHPGNPLIVQDLPWEKRTIQVYGTVLHDPVSNRYRCWYLGSHDPDSVPEYYQCYAESTDGLRWSKPLVNQKPMFGHSPHNIVVPGGHGLCILREPEDADPERRYKALGGDALAFSKDGISWTMKPFAASGKNDTGSSVVRFRGEYLAFVRNQEHPPDWSGGLMRAVALSTSKDFTTWTPKKTIFMTDELDGYPWTQPYGLEVTAYGDQLIGLLPLLHLDPVPGNNSVGLITVQLMVSRDGRQWQRVADRATFLRPTLDPTNTAWDSGGIFPATTMLVKDNEVRIYYTGTERRHGEGKGARKGIGLATLPADRFVSLSPSRGGVEGVLETRLLSTPGKELLVNATSRGGGLVVELLDKGGRVVPGFSRRECVLLPHDPLRYRVVWSGGRGLSDGIRILQEQPFAVRFILRSAELYAFQIPSDFHSDVGVRDADP